MMVNWVKTKSTLDSRIDVGQGINIGPGKFGLKNKRRSCNMQQFFVGV